MKKVAKKTLWCCLFIAVFSTLASAAQVWWNDQGPDHKWTTGDNWNVDHVPGAGEVAIFNLNYVDDVIVEAGDVISCEGVVVDWSVPEITIDMSGGSITTVYDVTVGAYSGAGGVINISGGTINAGRNVVLGRDADGDSGINNGDAYGIINMSGGVINANEVRIGEGGDGTVTMTGGTINARDWVWVGKEAGSSGTLNLWGGEIIAFDLRPHLNTDFQIDITEGRFTVDGDLRPRYGSWIGTHLTAYGGSGDIVMTYDDQADTTTVYAIPEPATLVMVSLGSLITTLRRKK